MIKKIEIFFKQFFHLILGKTQTLKNINFYRLKIYMHVQTHNFSTYTLKQNIKF